MLGLFTTGDRSFGVERDLVRDRYHSNFFMVWHLVCCLGGNPLAPRNLDPLRVFCYVSLRRHQPNGGAENSNCNCLRCS